LILYDELVSQLQKHGLLILNELEDYGLWGCLLPPAFSSARKREVSSVGNYAMEVRPKLAEIVKERVKP